jgi:hypothetical protein
LGGARTIVLSLDRTRIHNIEEKCSGNERNLVRAQSIAEFIIMSRSFIVFSCIVLSHSLSSGIK